MEDNSNALNKDNIEDKANTDKDANDNNANGDNDADEFISVDESTQQQLDVVVINKQNDKSNDNPYTNDITLFKEEIEKRLSNIETTQSSILNQNILISNRLTQINDLVQAILIDKAASEQTIKNSLYDHQTSIKNNLNTIIKLQNDYNQLKETIKAITDISFKYNEINQSIIDINTQILSLQSISIPNVTELSKQIDIINDKIQMNTDSIIKCEKLSMNTIKSLANSIVQEKTQTDTQLSALWNSITLIVQNNPNITPTDK